MLRKIMVLVFLLSAIYSPSLQSQDQAAAVAPEESEGFRLVARWKIGEQKRFLIKQNWEKQLRGEPIGQGLIEYRVNLRVLERKTQGGYTIEWHYRDVNAEKEKDELIQSIAQLTDGLRIEYSTFPHGGFEQIRNWEEIQMLLRQMGIELLKKYGENPKMKAALLQAQHLVTSRENFEQRLLRDIQLFHNPLGGSYRPGEPLVHETELPSVLGPEPLPALLVIDLATPEDGDYQVSIRQFLDKEKAAEQMFRFLKESAQAMGETSPSRELVPHVEINDESTYLIDPQSGWAKQIHFKREVINEHIRRIDTYEISEIK